MTKNPKQSGKPSASQSGSSTRPAAKNDVDYAKIGKQVVEMYDVLRPTKRQLYTSSFVKGFLGGFGGVLGATIGISILLYVLTMLETIPYIEDISKTIQHTIQSGTGQ